jgi:hypothetical protein
MGKKHQRQQLGKLLKELRFIVTTVGAYAHSELSYQHAQRQRRAAAEAIEVGYAQEKARLDHELNLKRAENERAEIQLRADELALRKTEIAARQKAELKHAHP